MDRATFLRRSAAGVGLLAFPALARAGGGAKLASLRAAVRGPVLTPASAGYDAARQVFDSAYASIRPLAVVQPLDANDVAAVVHWAAAHGEHVVAKSGGHSYAGYSTTTGVVVDLSRLAGIAVKPGRATIGAGARLGNIYDRLNAHGAAIPAGSCPTVGIGGHVLGGGFGLASRAWGLASDNLLSVQIVTADGKVRVVDAHHDPDLFWACRGGGGGNFGIATSFAFRTHAVSQGAYFVGTWPWTQVEEVVASYLAWAPKQPDALGAVCRLAGPSSAPTVQVFGQYLGSAAALTAALASLTPPAAKLTVAPSTWLDLVRRWAGCLSHTLPQCAAPVPQSFAGASDYIARQPAAAQLARFREALEQPGAQSGSLLIDAYGGALNRVAPAATAFVHRGQLASIQYFAAGPGASARTWVDGARALLRPVVSGEAYVNYIDPHLTDWQTAYYGANLPRLRRVKKTVDPHGLFRFPQSIPPA
ncbi:MAG TPA: FAD-binding oxidoreductase [Gaiellaceae bacterium]|nr:FAD-binding oxidoreductase [Gaiellaceae bacterium]